MSSHIPNSARVAAVLFLAVICAFLSCGCGVPVAPAYQIQKESLTVHFISGNPPHLAVRADYRLANIGNSPLHFIPLALPGEKDFGLANVGAQVDGNNVAPQHNPHEAADNWRIPLASPWRQKQKINLSLSYDLAASTPVDPRIFVAANFFYLNDSGWFPAFMGFKAFLSPGVTRPNTIAVSVTVPSDFRVAASGQPRGEQKHTGQTEYRFRIGKSDFNPYILAGQYNEKRVTASPTPVIFWRLAPVPAAQAQQTAEQIARASNFFSQTFGPLPKSIPAIHDIEVTAPSPSVDNWQPAPPPATIIEPSDSRESPQPSSQNVPGNSAAVELASTWFGHIIQPRPEAWKLADALAFYASSQLVEPNGASNRVVTANFLADYDRTVAQAVEKPLFALTQNDPAPQQRIASDKLQLFFFALEDKCGQQNVTHAIAHMVYALRGGEYGYPEFRSALEAQCHQDLAEFFRAWLARPGIPPDFRARYGDSRGPK